MRNSEDEEAYRTVKRLGDICRESADKKQAADKVRQEFPRTELLSILSCLESYNELPNPPQGA